MQLLVHWGKLIVKPCKTKRLLQTANKAWQAKKQESNCQHQKNHKTRRHHNRQRPVRHRTRNKGRKSIKSRDEVLEMKTTGTLLPTAKFYTCENNMFHRASPHNTLTILFENTWASRYKLTFWTSCKTERKGSRNTCYAAGKVLTDCKLLVKTETRRSNCHLVVSIKATPI